MQLRRPPILLPKGSSQRIFLLYQSIYNASAFYRPFPAHAVMSLLAFTLLLYLYFHIVECFQYVGACLTRGLSYKHYMNGPLQKGQFCENWSIITSIFCPFSFLIHCQRLINAQRWMAFEPLVTDVGLNCFNIDHFWQYKKVPNKLYRPQRKAPINGYLPTEYLFSLTLGYPCHVLIPNARGQRFQLECDWLSITQLFVLVFVYSLN